MTRLLFSVVVLSVVAMEAVAQQQATLARDVDRVARDQTLSSATSSSQNQVLFTIGPQAKLIQANLRGEAAGSIRYFARASGPIDESREPTQLADLDGLRASSRIALGISVENWEPSPDPDPERARLWCRTYYSSHLPPETAALNAARSIAVADSLARVRTSQGQEVSAGERERLVDSVDTHITEAAVEKIVNSRCIRSALPVEVRRDFDRESQVSFGTPWLFGVSLELARQGFTFADTVRSAITKDGKSALAFNVGTGVYWPQANLFAMVGLRHERSFQGGKVADYCLPIAGTTATRCQAVSFGAPAKQNATTFNVGVRWFAGEHVGFAPRLSFDLGTPGRVGFELPLLSRQADDKGFTSALILGVRSRDQRDPKGETEFTVAAQLGQVFGVNLP